MSHDPRPPTARDIAIQPVRIETSDGMDLEAEVAEPEPPGESAGGRGPEAVVVLCHPHPSYGGSMHANVVEALFRSLPPLGAAAVRFNFRGVGSSTGSHDDGQGERLDAIASVGYAAMRWPEANVVLAGYSFGADVSLSVDLPELSGWLAIAPPLRVIDPADMAALEDGRPKTLVGATNDQFNPYRDLVLAAESYPNTTVIEAEGADHFFATGLDHVVEAGKLALGLR